MQNKKEFENAIRDYTKVFETYTGSGYIDNVYCLRGTAYLETGKNDLAFADFNKAIESTAGKYNYGCRADGYLKAGKYQEAIKDYTKAIDILPDVCVTINRAPWRMRKSATKRKPKPTVKKRQS